jgi:hypothetical protein
VVDTGYRERKAQNQDHMHTNRRKEKKHKEYLAFKRTFLRAINLTNGLFITFHTMGV